MRYEIPVLNPDGTVIEGRRKLLRRLRNEAARGILRVNPYRGPEEVGSEAFYTLSDGTVLHEVNGTAGDGSDYRSIHLVVNKPKAAGWLSRILSELGGRWSPATRQ